MRFTSLWTSLASAFLGWCDPAPGCSLMLRQFSDLDLLQARSYCKGFSFLLLNAPTCFHTDFTSQAQVFLAMYIQIWSSSLRLGAVCWRLLGFIQHKVLQNTVQSLFWGLQLLSPAGNKEDRMCHAASRECWKNILLDILIYCFFHPFSPLPCFIYSPGLFFFFHLMHRLALRTRGCLPGWQVQFLPKPLSWASLSLWGSFKQEGVRRNTGEKVWRRGKTCSNKDAFALTQTIMIPSCLFHFLINILLPELCTLWTACHLIIFHWMENLSFH